MWNKLSGKRWIPNLEAKVAMTTMTKVQTVNTNKAFILCIEGGEL